MFGTLPYRAGAGIAVRSLGKPAAAFPGRLATDADLMIAVDRQQTRLALPLNASDTSMTVLDPSSIGANNLLTIDAEIVKTTGAPAGNVVPISRGFDGTTPALHLASAVVSGFVDAYHHNGLAAEVEAIEQALGPNLSNIASAGTFNSGVYDFVPQTPGGTLSPGLNVIPLSPVPRGINGSNTKHYLYISGGTGTAEAVLISGGTAVSGAASGTVIVSCANSHSGQWTIQSATKGIQEAEKSLPAEGGVVVIPGGNLQMQGPISYQRRRTFRGLGVSTRLLPASTSAIVFDSNLPIHPDSAYDIQSDDILFADFVIDGHMAGFIPSNNVTGIRHIAQNATEIHSIVGVHFERVYFNNIRNAILLHRVFDVSLEGVRVYSNSQIRFEDIAPASMNHNYQILVNNFEYSWRTMDGDVAHPTLSAAAVFHVENGELVYFSNSQFLMAGGDTGMDGIAFWGGAEDLSIVNTAIVNARVAIDFKPITIGGTAYYPGYAHLSNVSVDQIWGYAIFAADGISTGPFANVHNIVIDNCLFTNPHPSATNPCTAIQTGAYARHWNIANTQINIAQASATSGGLSIGANSAAIALNDNQIMNTTGIVATTLGIFVGANAAVYGLETTLFEGITTNVNDGANHVASAATITLPKGRKTVFIDGTATINQVNTCDQDVDTRIVTLIFTSAGCTVPDGGNLKLSAAFVSTAFSTLTVQCLSSFWVELSRSLN